MTTSAFGLFAAAGLLFAAACGGSSPTQTTPPPTTTPLLCSGMSFVFFNGGSATDTFAQTVYHGAQAATAALGPAVTYEWSDWNSDTMLNQFQQDITTTPLPDGIAIMGHPGDNKTYTNSGSLTFDSLITQARQAGILVTSQNTPLPLAEAEYAAQGFGYVGQNVPVAGTTLANGAIAKNLVPAGSEIGLWGVCSGGKCGPTNKGGDGNACCTEKQVGSLTTTICCDSTYLAGDTRAQRTWGIYKAFLDAGYTVDYQEISADANGAAANGVADFATFLTTYPAIKLMAFDHGGITGLASTYLTNASKSAGDIKVIGFDMSSTTADEIQQGWVSLVLDQQPYLQGFLPIVQLCLTKKFQFAGLYVDTGSGLVDSSNIASLLPLISQGLR